MRRLELAIDESKTIVAKVACKMYKCEVARTRAQREHAFPTLNTPGEHPIESPYQFIPFPYLYAHGMPQFIESGISLRHIIAEPCTSLMSTQ